ncbi:hypothetical protein [Myroides odoratus]|uniref:hypothetical protein n=1 Tax=Myroides odoratus TaxID=256 RepID=UPI0039B0AEAB
MNFLTSIRPSWQTRFSFALLSFGLYLNPVATLAQEKEQVTIKNKTLAYEITKETTASDLELIQKEINAEKIATLRFSDIKRNAQNEIIGITTQFKDEQGSSQQKSEYNSQGIRPFSIKIHENTEGYKYLEIANTPQQVFFSNSESIPSISNFLQDKKNSRTDYKKDDLMEMMRSMQESMQQQQDLILKIFEEAEKQQAEKSEE